MYGVFLSVYIISMRTNEYTVACLFFDFF